MLIKTRVLSKIATTIRDRVVEPHNESVESGGVAGNIHITVFENQLHVGAFYDRIHSSHERFVKAVPRDEDGLTHGIY